MDTRLLGHELKYTVAVASRVTEELGAFFAPGAETEGRFVQLGRALVEADQIAETLLGNVDGTQPAATPQPALDVDQLLTTMLPLIQRGIDPAITLSVRPSGTGSHVFANENDLAGLIRRLIDSAVDAMASGGELSVTTGWLDHIAAGRSGHGIGPRRYVRVSVSDTGPGHTHENWQRVLSLPDSGPSRTAVESSIAADVAQMGGYLILESADGEGSRVHMCLPAAQTPPAVGPSPLAG